MRPFPSLLLAGLLTLTSLSGASAATDALTVSQKGEVESIIRQLLTEKEPELVIKAAQAVQSKAEAENEAKSSEALKGQMDKVTQNPNSPVGGNPKGDVTVVEFFDYMCGYCKMTQENVTKFLDSDKNIRFVYKELPILGEDSLVASKAALASVAQGKYTAFHNALMSAKSRLSEESIMELAEKTGLDVKKLKEDMKSEKVLAMIKENNELAKALGIHGTPTFVIGDKMYPGAIPFEQMKQAVEELRTKAKKK